MFIFQGVIGIHFLASSEQPAELSILSILWQKIHVVDIYIYTLHKTNIASEKGWFSKTFAFPLGLRSSFRGELAVSFRECT